MRAAVFAGSVGVLAVGVLLAKKDVLADRLRLWTGKGDAAADPGAKEGTRSQRRVKDKVPSAPATPLAEALKGNQRLFSKKDQALIIQLLELGQGHLFSDWPAPGRSDKQKRGLVRQLARLDAGYPGGLTAYITNARKLLADSREGRNPFEGYKPSVPHGERLDFGSPQFLEVEDLGAKEAGSTAFVLVAGGLGERLGYSGIKVALPCESATDTSFLQLYCQYIKALQDRSAPAGRRLPFVIMTSDDTHGRTLALLESHHYFGLEKRQVHLVKQEKVGCLVDNDAHLALEATDPFSLQTKPHGHGDVHALLHRTGLAQHWLEAGLKWVVFFQDTNALVTKAIAAALGVSATHGYDMNSLAVPRKAKEAIGAITALTNASGSMTINVEYNQLDPLLRSTINKEGDVNDATGFSPFPGNINQFVIKLSSYVPQLAATGGVIAEFVNPKYKDATKTVFKSSTRLECMMQDYAKALPLSAKVGFTAINQGWASYSPVKNSVAEALAKAKEGNPTHSATAGELDMYKSTSLQLQQLCGADVGTPQAVTYNGISLEAYPRVMLSPSFAVTLSECKAKVLPGSIRLAPGAVLVIEGAGVTIEGPLDVEGALVIKAARNAKVTIKALTVRNAGWQWVPLADGEDAPEQLRIRGFKVQRSETHELRYTKAGLYTVDEPAVQGAATTPAAADAATAVASPEQLPESAPLPPLVAGEGSDPAVAALVRTVFSSLSAA